MASRWYLPTPRKAGWTGIIIGGFWAAYCFFNILRYWVNRDTGVIPSLWGATPMAFSTALMGVSFSIVAVGFGAVVRHIPSRDQRHGKRLTVSQKIEVAGMVVSLLIAIISAFVAIETRH